MKRGIAISVAALLVFAAPAEAAKLAKGTARAAAQLKAAKFTAAKDWAKAARLGKCKRVGLARVVCLGRVIGPRRNCHVRVVVWKVRKTNARLRSLRCGNTPPRLLATIRLRARLSSAPRRDLADPFKATYDYSAGATEQQAASEAVTEPPAGVLALYVDGILECAENIDQAKPDSECPVKHQALGTYRVTTIYTAGNESATDTMQYVLEPLATETTLSIDYSDLPGGPESLDKDPRCTFGFGCGFTCHFDHGSGIPGEEECHFQQAWTLGTLTVVAGSSPAGAVQLQCGAGSCPGETFTLDGEATFPVKMYAKGNGRRPPVGDQVPPSCQWMQERASQWKADLSAVTFTATPSAAGYERTPVMRTLDFAPTLPC